MVSCYWFALIRKVNPVLLNFRSLNCFVQTRVLLYKQPNLAGKARVFPPETMLYLADSFKLFVQIRLSAKTNKQAAKRVKTHESLHSKAVSTGGKGLIGSLEKVPGHLAGSLFRVYWETHTYTKTKSV